MIDASTRLRRAIELNNVVLVQRIIRTSPSLLQNPDWHDKANTSLHAAAALGSTEIVSFLVAAGHDRGEISRNVDHDTPLMLAARHGHVEVGRFLADAFPRCVTMVNRAGLDALAIACQQPVSAELISVLVDADECPAHVDGRDCEGNTPLHHASASGSLKALRILLSAGANPLARNNQDWAPLSYSQTVAAHVYFKNLIAEFERRKLDGQKLAEERERQRMGGLRVVDGDGMSPPRSFDLQAETEFVGESFTQHWSSPDRKRPLTPAGAAQASRSDWDLGLQHIRTRSGS